MQSGRVCVNVGGTAGNEIPVPDVRDSFFVFWRSYDFIDKAMARLSFLKNTHENTDYIEFYGGKYYDSQRRKF